MNIKRWMVAAAATAVLSLGVVGVVDTPVSKAAAAEASTAAPCSTMGHYDKYWTSHGMRHWADYRYHEWPYDRYNIYHVFPGWPYTVYVGQAICAHW